MSSRPYIFAIAAFALLLAAGTDLLIFDFASGIICEGDPASGSTTSLPDDDCFCCCAHIIMTTPPVTLPTQPAQALVPLTDSSAATPQLRTVYHPPRA